MQTTAMKIVAMLAITIQKSMIMTIMRPHFTMQASAINAVVELLTMQRSFRWSSRRWGHADQCDEEAHDGGAADQGAIGLLLIATLGPFRLVR